MQVYDWLLLTSIACLIVATIYVVYILRRVQRMLNDQTQQMMASKESLKAVPEQVTLEVRSTYDDVVRKVQLGWRIFSFLRNRRKKRNLKKQVTKS